MTKDEAVKFFARRVITSGKLKDNGCFVPPDCASNPKGPYALASKVMIKAFNVTHFGHEWIDVTKGLVKLSLFRGDCLGACLDLEKVQELEVCVFD
jgi:hypothetical protein